MVNEREPETGPPVSFRKMGGETKPPLADMSEEELGAPTMPQERVARAGKVPLHPAVIRLPFSIFGRIGTELTHYPGFTFTEQELNDLADLWIQCGIEASPMLQAAIGTTAMVGGKTLGYAAWVRAGKPPVPGAEAIGKEEASG